jgi:hypothetical protein
LIKQTAVKIDTLLTTLGTPAAHFNATTRCHGLVLESKANQHFSNDDRYQNE